MSPVIFYGVDSQRNEVAMMRLAWHQDPWCGGAKNGVEKPNQRKLKKTQRSGGLGREKGGRFLPLPYKTTTSNRSKG